MPILNPDFANDGTATATPISDQLARGRPSGAAQTPELSERGEPPWVSAVAEEIVKLRLLDRGWDGYGAGPIRGDVLNFATQLLARIMPGDTPPPHLTPMSHEGILIEWHQHGIELEIEVVAPTQVWVSYTADGEEEEEWSVRSDISSLQMPITELTRRAPSCLPTRPTMPTGDRESRGRTQHPVQVKPHMENGVFPFRGDLSRKDPGRTSRRS